MAVSSRLFEMLAEAKARPSGAFQDAMAGINAGNQVATSAYDYKKNERLDSKLSKLLDDPTYGEMTLRDVANKDSGLFELMKLKAENAPMDEYAPTYDSGGNPTGMSKIGTRPKRSGMLQPSSINITKEGLAHRENQDAVNNLQEELKAIRAAKDKVSILGTPVNQDKYDALTTRENYLTGELSKKGVRVQPPVKPVSAAPPPAPAPGPAAAPAPKYTEGQILKSPSTGKIFKVVNGVPIEVPRGTSK